MFSRTSTICSGQLLLATKCGTPKNDASACPSNGGGPYAPECCGGDTGPFYLYNAESKQCCPNGTVKSQNEQC